MAAYCRLMTHITCRLTAKNRDRLRNPTLGNRVWATFTFSVRVRCARQLSVRLRAHLRRSVERQRTDRIVLRPLVGRHRLLDDREHVRRVRHQEWAPRAVRAASARPHGRRHRQRPAAWIQGQLRHHRPIRRPR